MGRDMDVDAQIELVSQRGEFLEVLIDDQLRKRDLVDKLDTSRATVNRAISDLEAAGLVERGSEGHTATLAGRLALERYRAYVRESTAVLTASDVLAPLSPDCALDVDAIAGGDAHVAAEPAPYRPRELVHDSIARADAYRAVLPALAAPRHLRLCYEHVITQENPAALVVSPDLFETLRAEFPRQLPAMAATDAFAIHVGDVPEFGVVTTRTDGQATVSVLVFDAGGTLHGIVQNHTDDAALWADTLYDRVRADAEEATTRLRDGDDGADTMPDGAVPAVLRSGVQAPAAVPVALEAEGFVRLTSDYFADRRVSDPATAWRAGLDLAEVQAGYAVDRTLDRTDGADTLAGELHDRLRAGTDCAVVGPPGSGKSTVCKQAAVEWYRAGDPVFYRRSGRGRPFESVDELVAAVREAAGTPLVVVEDAAQPETSAVFTAMDALAEEDVAFLLDAREAEWHDPPVEVETDIERGAVEVVAMPRLLDPDYERLVEHFEDTVGESVDVPLERLREDVRGGLHVDEEAAPGEILLVLHRLALYADPLAEGGSSTLDADVRAVYRELRATGDLALDVGILVNLANAAGIEFIPDAAFALADGDGDSDDSDDGDDRVRDALARLEGRVLFPRGDEVRTVHELWSVEFLAHLLGDDEVAPERFGRCVTALLSVADDAECRERVRQVFALGREWPKLAPLFGTSEDPAIRLPDACREALQPRVTEWRGQMYLNGGYYDRAEREFEHLAEVAADRPADEAATLAIRRHQGLCDVAREQSDFETAVERGRECLARIDDAGTDYDEARCRYALGDIDVQRNELDAAQAHLRAALDLAERVGDRLIECNALRLLGNLHFRREQLADATAYYERTRALAREIGSRELEGAALTNLGNIAYMRGDVDTAEEYYHQGLEVAREIGDRRREAVNLRNLGLVARKQGDLATAEQYGRESLDLARQHDIGRLKLENRCDLGVVRRRRGDLDASEGDFERTVELATDLDMPHRRAQALAGLGALERRRGDFDAAEDYLDRALDGLDEEDDPSYVAKCRKRLGRVARDRGEFDRAADHAEGALATVRELGDRRGEVDCLLLLGSVRRRQGQPVAEEHLREALDLASEIDYAGGEIRCLRELGEFARERGAFDEAGARLTAGLDRARKRGDPWDEAAAVAALGRLERARDDLDAAGDRFERAAAAYRDLGALHRALDATEALVDIRARQDDLEAAREWCETAADLAGAAGRDRKQDDFHDRCDRLTAE